MRYWLVKSEPDVYSIDDLARDGSTSWDGVRNYQARNFMRDDMRVGDLVLFYHSNAAPPGVVGVAEVSREAHPDLLALDPRSDYFDPRATKDDPRWWMVDIAYRAHLPRPLSLQALRDAPELEGMLVTTKSRLSVQPVDPAHFAAVCKLGGLQWLAG